MRAQRARASPENPRIQTVIRADPRKADISSIKIGPKLYIQETVSGL